MDSAKDSTPCGLEGKKTTSFEKQGVKGETVEGVGKAYAEEIADRLGFHLVESRSVEEVEAYLNDR